MEWNKEKTLYFIEQYREETVLWDPGHPEHYNKIKKEDAWVRLSSLVGTQAECCKKKMTSLLASLRREKQKMKQSTGTGKGAEEVYRSTWFAYNTMIFLLDRNKPGATTDTLQKQNSIDCSPPDNKSGNDCPPPIKKRKKTVVPNPEDIMVSTLNILKKKTEETKSTPQKLDEFFLSFLASAPAVGQIIGLGRGLGDAFGVFLSNKLRSYSKTTRIYVQHYVSNILFGADRGEYDYVDNNNYGHTSSQGYSARPTTSQASSQLSSGASASYTSEQTDCQSPALSEVLSEFNDLI